MSILIAHPGSQHAPHLVRGLLNAGEKVEYHTIMMFGDDSSKPIILPEPMYRKRKVSGIPDNVIHRQESLEFIPAIVERLGIPDSRGNSLRNRMFQNGILSTSIRNASAIIGFDTSSHILAQRAKKMGVPFFLELTTPHALEKQKWSQYIKDNFPEWPSDLLMKPKSLIELEDQEVEMARVVSVPTSYIQRSHKQFSNTRQKFVVNPFGADLSEFHPKTTYNKRPRFVFLGMITAAKGIPVLLKAWESLNPDAELVIAGRGDIPEQVRLPKNVSLAGTIEKENRLDFFHSADVLICPSLYERLAIVQLEAAACGLAIIGTHNSGGAEFLNQGEEALFVEPGNVEQLATAIDRLCFDIALREKMGRAAAIKAQQYSWDAYVKRWLKLMPLYKRPGV